jgi:Flp pilus assembly protein TadG
MVTRPNRREKSRGAVLIEFVIVLPVFLLMLLASIDWGWYFVLRENVVHATREGARVGSVAPDTSTAATDATLAVRNYLTNVLGASRVRNPVVTTDGVVGGHRVISVRLVDYPAGSVTGLRNWTRVPETITTRADMRLEVQP